METAMSSKSRKSRFRHRQVRIAQAAETGIARVVAESLFLAEQLEGRFLLAVNPIVVENQLPGTPQGVWDVTGAGDATIQGFATDISINQGQTVSFKINDTAVAPYHIDIYRMGYYQGNGARLVTTIPSSQTIAKVQPAALVDQTTKLVDAGNWSVTASWAVPSNATSGIYFARVTRNDTGGASQIFFVVRNDSSHSALLFQTSDSTWEAYNTWGGYSLYQYTGNVAGPSPTGGAVAVSYNRPLTVRDTVGGLGDYNSPMHAEYPMVRWLEANGYDVSYFTDVDSDRNGALIKNHQVFMSVGHDEYISGGQRANIEAARDAGVNLAFFSGNEIFWKTRWQGSIDGSNTAYRTLVTYKESKSDDRTDPLYLSQGVWTGTWRDGRFSPPADGGRPENALTGTMYMNDRTNTDIGISMKVTAAEGQLRFWRNTAAAQLISGQTATIGDRVVGYEVDEDVDNGFRPVGLIDMSTTTFSTSSHVVSADGTVVGPGSGTHSITLYRAPSGALVFGAGTVQWSWGLDGQHDDGVSVPDRSMQQATVNLFADMNVQPGSLQPGLVPAVASTDIIAPTSSITTPANGASFVTGIPLTISGTSTDVGGGIVAGVEVSTDGGQTWHPAKGTANWTYSWVPDLAGQVSIEIRAVDDSGNVSSGGSGSTVTVTFQPTSRTGLVAEYAFNEGTGTTVADSSGNHNTGTITNASWAAGLFGQALSFNGTNSLVTISGSTSLNLTSAMTLEAWVKPNALDDWSSVILKERTGGLDYALYADSGADQPPIGFVHVSSSDSAAQATSILSVGTWSHLAATYDGTNLMLYVNGSLVSTQAVNGNIMTSSNALRIGGNSIWGEYFNGLIDQVRVYNRALNQGEVRADMSTPVGGSLETVPPSVSLTAPPAGASVSGTTPITATASDNLYVVGVQFLLDGQPLGKAVTTAPYTLAWDTRNVSNGSHVLAALAWDAAGNSTATAGRTLTVNNPADTAPPVVQVTTPLNGFAASGNVVLNAVANDNIGIATVQFQLDGINIGAPATTAPYHILWNSQSVVDGTYNITAVATDLSGVSVTSAPVSITVDHTAPLVVSTTPSDHSVGVPTASNLSVTFNEPIQSGTMKFELADPAGNTVASTISYDDTSHTATFSHGTVALDPLTTYTVTVNATDVAGNVAQISWFFSTGNAIVGATMWDGSTTPLVSSASDPSAVEVGVKFQSDVAGTISGIRFYKDASNTGTHVGHLWTSAGQLLSSATFTGETISGWQQVSFSTPVAILANTTYIASYYAPVGHYAGDGGYFASGGVDSGPLHALADAAGGGNGVYRYVTGGGFPNSTYNASNYWVDVVFNSTTQSTTPPAVIGETPLPSAADVPQNAPITVTFSKSVQPGSISFVLTDSSGHVVPSSVNYNSGANTAGLVPNSQLAATTTYIATVSGASDLSGNVMTTPFSWSFTTSNPSAPPSIISVTPEAGATGVAKGAEIEATFSKLVQAASISFVLTDSAGNVVPGTVNYEDEENTASFTPNAALSPLTSYTATVSGATDLSGNPMTSPYFWSFTTANPTGTSTIWSATTTPAVASASESNP
ncbi:MAG TPA: N,N-dimethylformamidase beta subunit family domain-containing protein, partial [Tepidisphaeraceae bacterium]